MIAITSAAPGSGKGYLTQGLGIIANGSLPEIRSLERNSESEMRKALFADLMQRRDVIVYDNMDGHMSSSVLSSFVTAENWSDRILGASKSGKVRNSALFMVNGCHMTFGQNLLRKYLPIRLKTAGKEHLFRNFGFIPPDAALQERPAILSAILTLAMLDTSAMPSDTTIGSFEQMAERIRKPIAMIAKRFPQLRLCDPVDVFRESLRTDPEGDTEYEILSEILKITGGEEFLSSDIQGGGEQTWRLHGLMGELSIAKMTMSSQSIGAVLGRLKDQPRFGLCLRYRRRDGRARWRIERLLWSVDRAEAGAACTAA